MVSAVLSAIGFPCLIFALALLVRQRAPRLSTNANGIALQTVIIMVVLIAIAGAIAAVLVSRGNQAVSEIERTNITTQPSNYSSQTLCEAAGFKWVNAGCQASEASDPGAGGAFNLFQTRAHCEGHNHVWTPGSGGSGGTCAANSDKTAYQSEAACTRGGGTWAASACT